MTVFERFCRVPGTRCAEIMEMIDKGLSDEEIGAKYKRQMEVGCDPAETIAVYRKAHDGTLAPPEGTPFRHDDKDERDAAIMALRQMGRNAKELQQIFGMAKSSIWRILRDQKKKNRPR